MRMCRFQSVFSYGPCSNKSAIWQVAMSDTMDSAMTQCSRRNRGANTRCGWVAACDMAISSEGNAADCMRVSLGTPLEKHLFGNPGRRMGSLSPNTRTKAILTVGRKIHACPHACFESLHGAIGNQPDRVWA